jgi:hypothetical protein
VSRRASPFAVNGVLMLYLVIPLALCVGCPVAWAVMVVLSR